MVRESRGPGRLIPVLSRLRSRDELVRELRCRVQLPMNGMQVALGCFDQRVTEDPPRHVERDPGIGEPGRAGVTESTLGEIWQGEIEQDLIPVRRVSDGRRREHAAPRPVEEWTAVPLV